jgi:hypothetical protein
MSQNSQPFKLASQLSEMHRSVVLANAKLFSPAMNGWPPNRHGGSFFVEPGQAAPLAGLTTNDQTTDDCQLSPAGRLKFTTSMRQSLLNLSRPLSQKYGDGHAAEQKGRKTRGRIAGSSGEALVPNPS